MIDVKNYYVINYVIYLTVIDLYIKSGLVRYKWIFGAKTLPNR